MSDEIIYLDAPPVGRKSFQLITESAGHYILVLVDEDGMVETMGEFTDRKNAQSACNMMSAILVDYCDEDGAEFAGFSKGKSTLSFKDFVEAILAKPCCLVTRKESPIATLL
ncbi:MAG: hypothetical protein IJG32_09850 [Selenomonadaceae bacterium]|nr:hypothetical protein [Selenomonadaceae bacterium]